MLRLPLEPDRKPTKRYATDVQIAELLDGYVFVTEKFDGSIVQFEKHHGKIIGRGRKKIIIQDGKQVEHTKPYRFIEEWYWDNYEYLELIPEGYTVFGEYLRVERTIRYDRLPDYYMVFDIHDGTNFLEPLDSKYGHVSELLDLWHVPVIGVSLDDRPITIKELTQLATRKRSVYGDRMEGFVVKNYGKQLFMKFVHFAFDKELENSPYWMRQPATFNAIEHDFSVTLRGHTLLPQSE